MNLEIIQKYLPSALISMLLSYSIIKIFNKSNRNKFEKPYDYLRLTKYELTRILEAHSFELVSIQHGPSSYLTIKQLQVLHYTNKSTKTKKSMRISLLLVPIINVVAISLNWLHKNNADIYLSNFVLARKINDN